MMSKLYKEKYLRKLRKRGQIDAFEVLIVIRNHYPIKREDVREITGMSKTRFKFAMEALKGKYWNVGGMLEPVTNTAVL